MPREPSTAEPRRLSRRDEPRHPRRLDVKGYDGYLDIGQYYSVPGAKWDSSQMHDALDQRIGTTLLFPVYDDLIGNGSNAQYHVIGWVGFHLPQLRSPREQRLHHGLLHRSDLERPAGHLRIRPAAELRRTFSPANRLVLEQRKTQVT